jgi:3-oxoacyl-[acyl-carrier protein] reductase
MDLGLMGHTALVMASSKGIGKAIAAALAHEGAAVAMVSRSLERVQEAAGEIGPEVVALEADTDDLDAMGDLPEEVSQRLGAVDILVTNTGGPPPGQALDHGIEDWEEAYRSLVLAPKVLIEAVLPGMRERGWGRILNVGSSSTEEPIPGLALSNVHRAATVGYFKTLAREVAVDGVTVNTVATGRFATDRLADNAGSMEAAEEAARRDVPAKRLGRPEEFGDLAAFLCSERAAFITGTVIPIDGGMLRG